MRYSISVLIMNIISIYIMVRNFNVIRIVL